MVNISRNDESIMINSRSVTQARVIIRALGGMSVEDLRPCQVNEKFKNIRGVITHLFETQTNKGDKMAYGRLSDGIEEVDLIFYPRTWAESPKITRGDIVAISGKFGHSVQELTYQINVDDVKNEFSINLE